MTARRPDAHRRAAAFTLAELLMVLAILAVAGLIVLPSISRLGMSEERRVRDGVVELVRGAQIAATEKGLPVSVVFDPGQRRLAALERGLALPSGWWVRATSEEDAPRRRGLKTAEEAAGRAPPARVMMTWTPGGLVTASDWVVVSEGGSRIRVIGNSIDGVRIE